MRGEVIAALGGVLLVAGLVSLPVYDGDGPGPGRWRQAPLTPRPLAALAGSPASCSPRASIPVFCTWSTGQSSCSLRFADGERLSRLECSARGLSYACTRPRGDDVCSWSDDPNGADVYDDAGRALGYLWGPALEAHLGPDRDRPGGVEVEREKRSCPDEGGDGGRLETR